MFDPDDSRKRMLDQPIKSRLSYACAQLILQWHQKIGIELARERFAGDNLDNYLSTVYRYEEMDLTFADHQRELANEQVSSTFEWFYSEKVSESIWQLHTESLQVDIDPPQTLGQVGRLILSLLEDTDDSQDASEHEQGGEAERLRLEVQTTSDEQLLSQARKFYEDLTSEEEYGIGGVNVMLSSSLERSHRRALSEEHKIMLLRPEVLGFRHVHKDELKDGILDKVRSGELHVDSIVGSPSSDKHTNAEES